MITLEESIAKQELMRVEKPVHVPIPCPIHPVGFKMLVKMYKTPKKIGSIELPQSRVKDEDAASMFCEVMEMGPNCFDPAKERFAQGPWCQIGDIVVMQSYSGRRFDVGDDEYRLINDDAIDGVVESKESLQNIRRAY